MPTTPDVFVCYSRVDRAEAERLAGTLKAAGLAVAWDEPIIAPDEMKDRATVAIRAAKAVLVLWTPHSVGNRLVVEEALDAARLGKLIELCGPGFDTAQRPPEMPQSPAIPSDDVRALNAALAAKGLTAKLGAAIPGASRPAPVVVAQTPHETAPPQVSRSPEPIETAVPADHPAQPAEPDPAAKPVLHLRHRSGLAAEAPVSARPRLAVAVAALAAVIVMLLLNDVLANESAGLLQAFGLAK